MCGWWRSRTLCAVSSACMHVRISWLFGSQNIQIFWVNSLTFLTDPLPQNLLNTSPSQAHLGFLGSFDMLFLMCQANYCEKISLMGIFSLVNCNTPGLLANFWMPWQLADRSTISFASLCRCIRRCLYLHAYDENRAIWHHNRSFWEHQWYHLYKQTRKLCYSKDDRAMRAI